MERLLWSVTCLNHDTCQRSMWTHEGADFAPHPVIGLVLQVGDAEKFPQALGFEGLDPFLGVSKQCPCFTATKDGGDKVYLCSIQGF